MSTSMTPLIFRGGLNRIFVATTYTVRADGRTVVHVKHDVTDQIMSLQGGFRVGAWDAAIAWCTLNRENLPVDDLLAQAWSANPYRSGTA